MKTLIATSLSTILLTGCIKPKARTAPISDSRIQESSESADAQPVLQNCYGDAVGARFFLDDIESEHREGNVSLPVFSEEGFVAGHIIVKPHRDGSYPYHASQVDVLEMSLCSLALEVDDFYYVESTGENLLDWGVTANDLEFTQDEGALMMNVSKETVRGSFVRYKVDFKGYDVFTEYAEAEASKVPASVAADPDYISSWGLPRAKGSFHFVLPEAWRKP